MVPITEDRSEGRITIMVGFTEVGRSSQFCTKTGAFALSVLRDSSASVVQYRTRRPGKWGIYGNNGNVFSITYGRSMADQSSIPTGRPAHKYMAVNNLLKVGRWNRSNIEAHGFPGLRSVAVPRRPRISPGVRGISLHRLCFRSSIQFESH